MDLGLDGRKVIVTGGTKGIGRAIAELFAAEGACVAICARDKAEVDSVTALLGRNGRKSFGAAVDVSDGPAVTAWVGEAAAALGGIDIVVPNVSALAVSASEEAWQAGFQTDIMGSVRVVAAAMPGSRNRMRAASSSSAASPDARWILRPARMARSRRR